MADTKISAATLTTPASTDLIPLERPSSAVARYATVAAIVQAQAASTAEKGAVELATTAEAQAGSDATRAVTPAGLAAYFDQTLLTGDDFKFRLAAQTRPEYFQMQTYEVLFSGVQDPVMYWGWNISGTGLIDATKGAIWQQFEYDYYVGGSHYMEWNFNATDDNGDSIRYMAFLTNKTDIHEAYWWWWIGNTANSFFMISDSVTSATILEVYSKSDYPLLRLTGSAIVTTDYNAAIIAPVITSSGNGAVFGTRIASTISAGDGGNVSALGTMRVEAPAITITNGSTLFYPSTLQVVGPPTTGAYPWSFFVESGNSNFGGNLSIAGAAYDTPTDPIDIITGTLRQRTAKTPANAGASGRAGQICWDADYIYVCTATNTWKRAGIATWT